MKVLESEITKKDDQYYPLNVDEVMACFRSRWQVTYDLQLIKRNKCLYIQIMWGYLEQKSFPLDEEEYILHLNNVLEVINRIGSANQVREWLFNTPRKPRIGRAISLPLRSGEGLEEYLL